MDFFDTSVLLAAFDSGDSGHVRAWDLYAGTGVAAISQHTLAETFSILTGRRGVKPQVAFELISNNTGHLRKISLTDPEYLRCMREAEPLGIRGGAMYDALILACARKAKAASIWTFNTRHFQTFAPDLRGRVQTP